MSAPQTRWFLGYGLLLVSTCCAAAGQILFKLGAANRRSLQELVNVQVAGGGVLYGVGAVLWVLALTRLPLSVAYPFTALTFLFVYVGSIYVLGERPGPMAIFGAVLVIMGIGAILWSRG